MPLHVVERAGQPVDEPDGAVSDDGLLVGTYLHGLFENAPVREALLAWLRARRGEVAAATEPAAPVSPVAPADPYERWADVLEQTLAVEHLLACCGVAVPGR